MNEPAVMAYVTVDKILQQGSAKDGQADAWRGKGKAYHLRKAAKHAIRAYLMYRGWMKPDNEGWRGHAENAAARLAMVFCL